MENTTSKFAINVPTAVIIAGLLIAGAIIFRGNAPIPTDNQAAVGDAAHNDPLAMAAEMPPIAQDEHLIGAPDAPIIIVEYSDTECPFCKRVHLTLNQIIREYDGTVAWAYRHFPLDNLHPKARKEAEATECAAELGGNEGFWNYINRLFEVTPTNNGLDLALLPEIAEEVGLDREIFTECLDSGKYADTVQEHQDGGIAAGARSTPSTFIIIPDGTVVPLQAGALPIEYFRGVIETIIEEEGLEVDVEETEE